VKDGHGLPPVTAGIGVWLDGVGGDGTYGTAERMNGRTRLHRCREGVPINNCARIEGLLEKTGHKMCRHQLNGWSWKDDEKVRWKYQPDREDSCTVYEMFDTITCVRRCSCLVALAH